MIAIALVTINVAAILLAIQTPIIVTDAGRLALVAAVTALVVCSPLADGMPIIDRLIAATIGGYALHRILAHALGPVPYRVLRKPPRALLDARPTAYTMQLNVARVAVTV